MQSSLACGIEEERLAASEPAILFPVLVQIERRVVRAARLVHQQRQVLVHEGKEAHAQTAAARVARALALLELPCL